MFVAGGEKKKDWFKARTENQNIFLFQMCSRPHMVLVLAYILRISAVTHDPSSSDRHDFGCLTQGFNSTLCPPKFKGHLQGAAN